MTITGNDWNSPRERMNPRKVQRAKSQQGMHVLRGSSCPPISMRWTRMLVVALIPAIVVAVCMSVGVVLNRIDAVRSAVVIEHANVVALRLELALQRRTLQQLAERDSGVDNLCRERTTALKGAIDSLLRVNVVAFERHPGVLWKEWR